MTRTIIPKTPDTVQTDRPDDLLTLADAAALVNTNVATLDNLVRLHAVTGLNMGMPGYNVDGVMMVSRRVLLIMFPPNTWRDMIDYEDCFYLPYTPDMVCPEEGIDIHSVHSTRVLCRLMTNVPAGKLALILTADGYRFRRILTENDNAGVVAQVLELETRFSPIPCEQTQQGEQI